MRGTGSTLIGMVHAVSGLLALLSLPISLLGGKPTLASVSSLVGLFLAIYFITGVALVYETIAVVEDSRRQYSSLVERLKTLIETQPVNSPIYLYGYQNLKILNYTRESSLKTFLVLLVFSVINQIPLLNVIPLVYYLGGQISKFRNLIILMGQVGLGGRYVPDAMGLEIATILTNGFTFGLLVRRLDQLRQVAQSSLPQQDQGLNQGSLYGGGGLSP
ncbi:hypothetical protein GWK48_08055 [Metallosphaera tengchongensis]|uniref:Uncharacterized protein n=1 Tax=Metallosphaera tengchongensis TaxID=1532350 RepID=A0A6N0NVT8_9CREN|nr:hypothetical protein [Metallosphaera tengchongensis]QKR00335.1 hypothetical protein GWK48_08055 [Metallosphaera tengchongensis]